jgi:serine/threonine-protein kinase
LLDLSAPTSPPPRPSRAVTAGRGREEAGGTDGYDPFPAGTVVGDGFEVLGVLGRGGMGVVYEARDRKLARLVALKVNQPVYGPSLAQEAQALAAVRHPGFVAVHQLGFHAGLDFIVMERLFGETLAERLAEISARGDRMELGEALDVLVGVADALAAAHRAGIGQRDLKPSNVFLCGERVVLFDMGVFVADALAETQDVEFGGTPEYVAPEVVLASVARGEGHLVDLYALGIIAYEVLTNATPYGGDSIGFILSNHVSRPAPDVRGLRAVPPALALLISELLAKDPRKRPPSAEAVVWELQRIRAAREAPARRGRVVVVDDEPSVGQALKRVLERSFPDLDVEATTDPESALAGPASDIVLVDLNMPRMNGVEVCMTLLALPLAQRPRIVAMSGHASPDDVALLRSLGVVEFLPKDGDLARAATAVVERLRARAAAAAH